MIREARRRKELHDFLQAARGRLQPEDIGLKPAPNRRGAGLHQADVAAALAVSGRWYNGFENGATHGTPAEDLLDRLAETLRLTPAERIHLYLLAAGHEPAPAAAEPPGPGDASHAALRRLTTLIGPDLPAVLCDVAWNVLAWNDAMTDRIHDPAATPPPERNAILWLFTPQAEQLLADIGRARDEDIGQVHLAVARYPGNPQLEHLTDRLQQIPAAARLWNRQHIQGSTAISPRQVRPPGSGTFTQTDLISVEFPVPGRTRLLVLVPREDWPVTSPRIIGHLIPRRRAS
jgi:transcriptional regulator with XRE-family HTH domain